MKARPLRIALLALSGVFAGALASCGGSDDAAFSLATPPGTDGGDCRSDSSCDPGLVCRLGVCVTAQGSGGTNNTGGSGTSTAGDSPSGGKGMTTGGTNPSGGANMSDGGASPGAGGGDGEPGAAGESSSSAGAGGGAPVECDGSHPLVSDQNRYCAVGDCYCNDPFDTCFPAETASACCENTPRCGANPGDRGVNCTGGHPIIGPPRTCASGSCFCSDGDGGDWDVCLPQAVADSCCPPGVSLTCVE
jgi:hypothetical protein